MKLNLLGVLLLSIGFFPAAYGISIKRNVFPSEITPDQYITVGVEIKREGTTGFAKIQESIPKGFNLKMLEDGGAKFLEEENEFRLVWLVMPEVDVINVKYRLIPDSNITSGTYSIKGKFNYILENDRKLVAISASTFKVLEPKEDKKPKKEVVIADNQKSDSFSETTSESPSTETSELKDVQTEMKKEIEKVELEKKKSTTSAIVYKVQLGAFSKEKSKSLFGDLPDIHFDKISGLYKYYSGNFATEEEARKVVAQAKEAGFPGAFLVRFKDGKRL